MLPELEAGRGFEQPELHYYTVLEHNLAAVAAFDAARGEGARGATLREMSRWFDLDASLEPEVEGLPLWAAGRLACLLHDVAKPETATREDGRLRFPRHGPRGAELMRERLPALGFGPQTTDLVARMIRMHLRPMEIVRNHPASDRAVRKFVADADGHALLLMLVNLADGWATRGPNYADENFERHAGFLNYVVARAWSVTQPGEEPLLTGEEVMAELDLRSGRLLGAVLTSVRRAQEKREIRTREAALALAREMLASMATGNANATPAEE